jgi:hypothetical protein
MLGVLRREFDETDIDAVVRDIDLHELTDGEESSESDFDVVTRAKTLKTQTKKKSVRFNSKTVPAAPIVEPIPVPDFDKLNRQIQELALNKERLLQQLASTRNPNASTLAEQRCFICDGAYPHHLGPANCPDVRNLINEGLAMYSP